MTEEGLFMCLDKTDRVFKRGFNDLTILTDFHALTCRFTHRQYHEQCQQYAR